MRAALAIGRKQGPEAAVAPARRKASADVLVQRSVGNAAVAAMFARCPDGDRRETRDDRSLLDRRGEDSQRR
jgi:hypothetical protein